ncbi:hypothetical protein QRX60_35445 [Amycolatopsis mongoliensis]|uniref:Uncharacterized protein n=1 Tax=Amycolatopsis mongoliensis TaxID=715475 RepID=A0A9Y2JKZ3_9PSEU|nr:hypothetical protein [Amycolatopsis sp. 4-36]WIX99316.1 hypothetical protein QRX60_35445 [Amycolatopsis sp. 4-36]
MHSPDATPEDRKHFSRSLDFEPLLEESTFQELSTGKELVPVHLHVGMEQGFREVGPRISIWSDFTSHNIDLDLTVTEAEQVGRMLLKLARQARGVRYPRPRWQQRVLRIVSPQWRAKARRVAELGRLVDLAKQADPVEDGQ